MPEWAEASVGSRASARSKAADRLGGAAEGDQRGALVPPGLGAVGPQRDRALDHLERPLADLGDAEVVALDVEGGPEVELRSGVARVEGDRPFEVGDRTVE